jgi:hypothetical protein
MEAVFFAILTQCFKTITMKNAILPLFLLVLFLFSQCKEDEDEDQPATPAVTLPEVITSEVDSITEMSAVVAAEIISNGNSEILIKGLCYGTEPNPDLDGSTTTETIESDIFMSSLNGLSMGTEYFVRAYAFNALGVSYGNELNFTTGSETNSGLPEVSTIEVDSISSDGALVRAEVISSGTSAITQRGVCYGLSQNPDLTGMSTTEDGFSGEFTSALEGLSPDTEYFVRAYASNNSGVTYGNELNFSTPSIAALVEGFESSSVSIDFSGGGYIFFTAAFNVQTNWTIEITGLESDAIKTISGDSQTIDQSNSTWNGSATATSIFKAEQCEVKLIVPNNPFIEETIQIDVLGPKLLGGDLITDFEQDLGSNLFIGDFEFELIADVGQVQDANAVQGSSYLYLEGTDNSSGGPTDNFFVGLARVFATLQGSPYFSIPTTDPSQVYFNALAYNELLYSRVVVGFIIDTNDSGVFDQGVDEVRSIEYSGAPESPSGWNDLNFTMLDAGVSSDELSKVLGIEFALISLNNLQPIPREPVGFGFDYLAFSVGQPLDF